MNNVLITGINGQDGVILTSKLLKLSKDINILGTSRTPDKSSFLNKISIFNEIKDLPNVNIIDVDFFDTKQLNKIITNFRPDTVFNLMGPSNVNESINNEDYYFKNIYLSFECLVKQLNQLNKKIKFFQASSSEMYGNNGEKVLDEKSKFNPNSAYAEAKLINHKKILMYKNELNWNITSGIMFNHESEFRKNNFLFMKIINKALEIKKKNKGFLEVGSLDYKRDWSYAQDIVDAMYLINKNPKSGVYVIGSGSSYSIERIIDRVFNVLNLDYKNYIKVNPKLLRDGDPVEIFSNPQKLKNDYRWEPKYNLESFIKKIINYQNLVK